ncbi:NAD synthetase [Pseudomonas sp. RIT-PI-AD]|uniref:NAD synthetase n=1 Tax=Pseudomonas sp. RIT-PI-AD TaxID=3035294 RepID=UPI0021D99A6E|nr:NAD synthetase [Pseudomonas sp. RIT-PI-AD]
MLGFETSLNAQFQRQKIDARFRMEPLFSAIDKDPELIGSGVIYIDSDYQVYRLREFRSICSRAPKNIIIREVSVSAPVSQVVAEISNSARESRVIKEAISMSLSCTGAVVSWLAMIAGGVGTPFTMGTSTALMYLGMASAAASTAQCLAGGLRTYQEAIGDSGFNTWLDSEDWYTNTMLCLDSLSLASAAGSYASLGRQLIILKHSTGRGWRSILDGLNKHERYKLTREMLKIQHPNMSLQTLKMRQTMNQLPRAYSAPQLRATTRSLIVDAVAASLSVAGSTYAGSVKLLIGLAVEQ